MKLRRQARPRLVWTPADRVREFRARRYCESPRHEGMLRRARWAMAIAGGEYTPGVQQMMCQECMTLIASELGTTPELGAIEL